MAGSPSEDPWSDMDLVDDPWSDMDPIDKSWVADSPSEDPWSDMDPVDDPWSDMDPIDEPWVDILTLSEVQQYDDAFTSVDKKGTGFISIGDLGALLILVGSRPTSTELHDMLKKLDDYDTGLISLRDFFLLMASQKTRSSKLGATPKRKGR